MLHCSQHSGPHKSGISLEEQIIEVIHQNAVEQNCQRNAHVFDPLAKQMQMSSTWTHSLSS